MRHRSRRRAGSRLAGGGDRLASLVAGLLVVGATQVSAATSALGDASSGCVAASASTRSTRPTAVWSRAASASLADRCPEHGLVFARQGSSGLEACAAEVVIAVGTPLACARVRALARGSRCLVFRASTLRGQPAGLPLYGRWRAAAPGGRCR